MASLIGIGTDPISSALAVIESINQVLVALINKASTPEIDALIQSHINHRNAMMDFMERLAEKIHGMSKPAIAIPQMQQVIQTTGSK